MLSEVEEDLILINKEFILIKGNIILIIDLMENDFEQKAILTCS